MKGLFKGILFFVIFTLISSCIVQDGKFKGAFSTTEESVAMDAAPVTMKGRSFNSNSSIQVPTEKKMVYRAQLTIETTDLVGSRDKIFGLLDEKKGLLDHNDQNEERFQLNLKIPAEEFTPFIDEVKAIGRILNSSITATDVTEQYIDTESRIQSKRALLEKYQSYLPQAKDLNEIMEVERQINNATAELEQWEGRMKRLENDIQYSQITIFLQLPEYETKESVKEILDRIYPNIGHNLGVVFTFIGLGIIYIVAVAGPFVLVSLLILGIVKLIKKKKRKK